MTGQEIALILQLLKIVCPQLQRMAKQSANPFNDILVGFICSLATLDIPPEILKLGGKQNG